MGHLRTGSKEELLRVFTLTVCLQNEQSLTILQGNIYRECNFKFRDVILYPTVARGTGTCITTLPPLKKKLIGFGQIRWVSLGRLGGRCPPLPPLGYATAYGSVAGDLKPGHPCLASR